MALNRQHPFFSPIGCLGGLILICGIVVAVVLSGGAIFSPGPLTAYADNQQPLGGFSAHAEFEDDCTQCHAPFSGITPERCEACHAAIAAERSGQTGLHGKLAAPEAARCEKCHPDHAGRQLNPDVAALKKFDHALLGFALVRHIADYDGQPLECRACHAGREYQVDPAACVNCHAGHDKAFMLDHLQAFGLECRQCHDGVDATTGFDHGRTHFALAGRHHDLECASCHAPQVKPADTPADCASCHTEPALHAGDFTAQDCGACHTPAAWSPATLPEQPAFRHADAAFQLVNHAQTYEQTPLTCSACHPNAGQSDFSALPQPCVDCHRRHDAAFMNEHLGKYGQECVNCHNGAGNMRNFDHTLVFALEGQHADLACPACHVDQKFRGTPTACSDCHQEPDIHAGVFGLDCVACHTPAAWAPARLTRHTFPLDHGHQGEIACATCHPASDSAYTCYGCHDHTLAETQSQHAPQALTSEQLADCVACHASGTVETPGGG